MHGIVGVTSEVRMTLMAIATDPSSNKDPADRRFSGRAARLRVNSRRRKLQEGRAQAVWCRASVAHFRTVWGSWSCWSRSLTSTQLQPHRGPSALVSGCLAPACMIPTSGESTACLIDLGMRVFAAAQLCCAMVRLRPPFSHHVTPLVRL
jgi:hypothetical protein